MMKPISYRWYTYFNIVRQLITAFAFLLFGLSVANEQNSSNDGSAILWIIIVVCILGYALDAMFRSQLKKQSWQHIAEKYATTPQKWWEPGRPTGASSGPLVRTGQVDVSVNRELQLISPAGTLREVRYTYSISDLISASNSRFSLDYIVLSLPLQSTIPHIYIDSTKDNSFRTKFDDLWSLHVKLPKKYRMIDLEGDFYKFFKVYTADSAALDALTIITPDVMLRLRDEGYNFDYELYQDHLYIMHSADILRLEEFEAMLAAASACLEELLPQIADHTFTTADSQIPANLSRLRRAAIWNGIRIMLTVFLKYTASMIAGIALAQFLYGPN